MRDGYGLMKYLEHRDCEDYVEYDGQWVEQQKHGEGMFKEESTGRVERRLYENDEVKEVLEIIEQGQ